jgi:ribonuclease Z
MDDDPIRQRPIIALAFDLMTLPLKDFWKMEHYTEALEELFVEVEGAESESGHSEVGDAVVDRKTAATGGKQSKSNQKEQKSVNPAKSTSKRKRAETQPNGDLNSRGSASSEGDVKRCKTGDESGGEPVVSA